MNKKIKIKLPLNNNIYSSIVLTHFCETHGPSVVFTTQLEDINDENVNCTDNNSNGNELQHDSDEEIITLSKLFESSIDDCKESIYKDNLTQYNNKISSTYSVYLSTLNDSTSNITTTTTTTTTNTINSTKCPTCSSLNQGSALISKDLNNKSYYYISTHQPSNHTYSNIRTSCVRSLSCEAVPNREGPVLINSNDGCFLSYMFKVNDSRARGSARWYGFMFIIQEPSCLVNYFSWIISCLKSIADEVKQRTNIVYEKEKSQQTQQSSVISSMYRRGTRSVPLKPLTELIEDPYFFNRLHRSFSNILSTCQLKYHLLTGITPIIKEQKDIMTLFKEKFLESQIQTQNFGNAELSSLQYLLLQDQATFFPIQEELITSFSQVNKIIGEERISTLIYNVIIGNQVVVRGSNEKLVYSFVNLLKSLIPQECCQVCYYSETFKEIWEANILGIHSNVIIPRHIDQKNTVVLDIEYYDKSNEPEDFDHPLRSTIEITLHNGTNKYPTSLSQAIELIVKQNYPAHIEMIHLTSIKDEWINKTKAFYGLKTIIENEKDKKLASFLVYTNCIHPKDMEILMFWSTCVRKWFISLK